MNDKEIYAHLKQAGWRESYQHDRLVKCYRFEVSTADGLAYFYLDRNEPDARICMHPKFAKHAGSFEAIRGVRCGMKKAGELLGKSSNMRDFPSTKGRTGSSIPQFFPIALESAEALKKALELVHSLVNARPVASSTSGSPTVNAAVSKSHPDDNASDSDKTRITDVSTTLTPSDGQQDSAIASSDQAALASDTQSLKTDEREAVVKVRFGQGEFRDALLREDGEKCWMSGIEGKRLLIASHIKPWSRCKDEPESRGQPDNGLLLSSLWDTVFDAGLIFFDEDWTVVASSELSQTAKDALGLTDSTSLPEKFRNERRYKYLAYHRSNVFEHWKKGEDSNTGDLSVANLEKVKPWLFST